MKIHSVTDISHTFSFYFDGRFGKNYVTPTGGVNVQNWGTLHKCDLSNINLLILQSEASPCPFVLEDVQAVEEFIKSGGGVVVLGNHALFRDEQEYRLNELAVEFGAEFVEADAKRPFKTVDSLKTDTLKDYGGKTIELQDSDAWEILIQDAKGKVLMARRKIGKGKLLVASRALCGRQPDAKDPINASMWQSLLSDLVSGKTIDASKRPASSPPENKTEKTGLVIQYSDYLESFAESIFEVYDKSLPLLEKILGVPPTKGMLKSLLLLPTGGGGFSSGVAIGLGVWWGNFPEELYGMVELVGHEATHSWVLPFPEPMWNEGIATYIGILLGREFGLNEDADRHLKNWIDRAKQHDPEMNKLDIAQREGIPHNVRMAKPMWIFEQLRKDESEIISKYFQAKRRLIDPDKRKKFTADDSVAVLSVAAGRNLFDWFKTLGITVNEDKTNVPHPE